MNKKRIILDSNVILSAALFKKSVPRQVLDKYLVSGKILMSSATLAEVQELFGRSTKFDKYLSTVSRLEFLSDLIESVEMIEIIQKLISVVTPKITNFSNLPSMEKPIT